LPLTVWVDCKRLGAGTKYDTHGLRAFTACSPDFSRTLVITREGLGRKLPDPSIQLESKKLEFQVLKSTYHVIIVGAGPAGSAAAYTLASAGLDVCLIDKSVFPRNKLCGGLLTLRSWKIYNQIFKTDWAPTILNTSRGIDFYYRNRFLCSVDDYSSLFSTQRSIFDMFLVQQAKGKGAVFLQGMPVKTVDIQSSSVRLQNGKILKAAYIIGADGANSILARSLPGNSFNKKNMALGLEMEVPILEKYNKRNQPEIYFGIVNWGYGWVFPKKETFTVGIGGSLKKNKDIRNVFKHFLKQRFGDVPRGNIKGHFLPFGNYHPKPGCNNVLLCGDAAGLVEPITGEGIAFAMQSGHYAAQAVLYATNQNNPQSAYRHYLEKYHQITRLFKYANVMKYFIFPKISEKIFINTLPKTRTVPRKQMDLMADAIDYKDYVKFLLKKLFLAIFFFPKTHDNSNK